MSEPQVPPAATSPALLEAASLVGSWRIAGNGVECALEVFEDPALTPVDPSVPMLGARSAGNCPGLEDMQGLQPIPLGFALVRANGGAVAFERVGPGRFRSVDQVWTVSRG